MCTQALDCKSMVRKASSVRALDILIAKPIYGYDSVDAYYADSHCCELLEHVAVPTLVLNARCGLPAAPLKCGFQCRCKCH